MAETKRLSCILCPRGCALELSVEGDELTVRGHACPRGEAYGRQEAIAPMRSLTSTVRAEGGARPRVAVRTTGDIPLARMLEAVYALDDILAVAPVAAGQLLKADFLGLGVDLIASDELKALAPAGPGPGGAASAPGGRAGDVSGYAPDGAPGGQR